MGAERSDSQFILSKAKIKHRTKAWSRRTGARGSCPGFGQGVNMEGSNSSRENFSVWQPVLPDWIARINRTAVFFGGSPLHTEPERANFFVATCLQIGRASCRERVEV